MMRAPEIWYPLRVLVCDQCWLVQTDDYAVRDQLFLPDYAYFSSTSSSWLKHAEQYVDNMAQRFSLDNAHLVVEVAANDGYLLQFFKQKSIPCIGIEPTHATAEAARKKGLDIVEQFFDIELAQELCRRGKQADLMIANNVLAHVPDINDFVQGFAKLLKPSGIATFEFPHLLQMIQQGQFDTIYHEHFSYLSLTSVSKIFSANGLQIFDVETLPTHGGSLRIFAQRDSSPTHDICPIVSQLLAHEKRSGMQNLEFYSRFQSVAENAKTSLLQFLLAAKINGESVVAYGAAAKGNTLLNYAGVKPDLLPKVFDAAAAKQGKYLPGSRIPILPPGDIKKNRPDYILILPWNIRDEIMQQLDFATGWGVRFVTAIPSAKVFTNS